MRLEQITAVALEKVGFDKYLLAEGVSKRSKEISAGAKPLVDMDPKKFKHTDIAISEVAAGMIEVKSS
ncbi:MAG: DNA-directed RNA polymerase subunit omega [Campylobacterota bacterium]